MKGTKYQLKGWQMVKEENAELLIDGKRVENDYTFVADDEEMKVEIAYTFNASALGGKNLVTFEELYDLSNPDEPVKVAEHKDIEDDGQTVLITERIIRIHTTAADLDGDKEIQADKEITIIDTVTLEGLEVGTKYQLKGWQMVKEENAELLIDGKRVENDYTFIADKENMTVEIAFTFDASTLGGKQLVTFEELYDLSNPDEPKKVAEHKDIEDDGQTVTIKEIPEEPEVPEKPEEPTTPEKPSQPTDSPKTGDNTNVMAFVVLLLASAGMLSGTYLWKKYRKKEDTNGLYPVIAVWENVMGAFSSNDRMDFRAVLQSFSDTEISTPPDWRMGLTPVWCEGERLTCAGGSWMPSIGESPGLFSEEKENLPCGRF